MSDKNEILQEGLEFASPLISQWVIPKVKELLNSSTNKFILKGKEVSHDYYKNRFETYLSERYTKFFVLETLVFPSLPVIFDDIYYPLTVNCYDGNNEVEIRVDNYNDDFIPKYKRVLIQDDAGMGKSTILRKLFLSCIRENKGIPILIELRKLDRDNTVFNEISNQLSSLSKPIEKEFLINLVERGDFIFFFDGLDEISFESRSYVLADILGFIEKAGNNLFVISSRPENIVGSFTEFLKFSINELEIEEAFQLFKNYDLYSHKKIAEDLTNILNTRQLESVNEFLKNPFLTSLVYKTFSYKGDIPKQKEQFYRKVYDALYEEHDLSKEGYYLRDKYSGLGIDDFERVLRCIGYKTMRQEKVELSKNQLLEIINGAKKYCIGLNFTASDFLKDLTNTVPLFKLEGLNNYKWIHKSYRDYFAARFILYNTSERTNETINNLFKNEELNVNTIDFIASMEPKIMKYNILNQILESYIKDYKSFIDKNDLDIIDDKNCYFFSFLNFYKVSLCLINLHIGDKSKKRNNFRSVLESLSKIELASRDPQMYKISSSQDNKFHLCVTYYEVPETYRRNVYQLIENKYPNLFIDIPTPSRDNNYINSKTWEFIKNNLQVDQFLILNEDTIKNFDNDAIHEIILYSLMLAQGVGIPIFSFKEACEMKKEIEGEIQNENKAVDFF